MLVLSRLCQESVMIGDNIEVKVVDVHGDKVRLGFVAPNSVKILRREIYNKQRMTEGPDDIDDGFPNSK